LSTLNRLIADAGLTDTLNGTGHVLRHRCSDAAGQCRAEEHGTKECKFHGRTSR
jgi:hypothetical protein